MKSNAVCTFPHLFARKWWDWMPWSWLFIEGLVHASLISCGVKAYTDLPGHQAGFSFQTLLHLNLTDIDLMWVTSGITLPNVCLQLVTETFIINQSLICSLFLGNILSWVDFFFSCLGNPRLGLPGWLSDRESQLPMQETRRRRCWSLGWEDPRRRRCQPSLAWRISWTEEPGGLQSTESHRVRLGWAHSHPSSASVQYNFWRRRPSRIPPLRWMELQSGGRPPAGTAHTERPRRAMWGPGAGRRGTEGSRGWKGSFDGEEPEDKVNCGDSGHSAERPKHDVQVLEGSLVFISGHWASERRWKPVPFRQWCSFFPVIFWD